MAQLRRKPVSSSEKKSKNPIAKAMSRARHSSFYHDLSLRGKNPLRLLGTPKDIWPGSATAGTKMLGGRMMAAGHILENPNNEQNVWPNGDVWRAAGLSDTWQEHLHSFRWLRDLNQAVDRKAAKARAEELVESWIEENTQWGDISWRSDIVGERVTNWLIYAPLIMDTDDVIYRGRVLDILARSARHLMKMSTDLPEGPGGLKAIIGLAFSGLYIPLGDSWLKQAVGHLKFSLGKEILVDGGIRSRNPQELLHLFMHMVLLRDAFAGMGKEAPEELGKAVSRMASCLRALSHGDGKLPLFNGVTVERVEDINTVIEKAGEEYSAEVDLEQSGFARLENEKTILLQDVGPPAEMEISRSCHAGTLSFELSHGNDRIIVNSGNAAYVNIDGKIPEALSRSTAAHSTLVLNNENSSDVLDDGFIGRGITEVSSKLISEAGHHMLEAEHNGYVNNHGMMHRRLIYMNDMGDDIRGEDELKLSYKGDKMPIPFDISFYLHPNISVSRQGDQIVLDTASGTKWAFMARGAEASISESIYFGDAGKVSPSQQIRLSSATDGEKTTVLWSLKLLKSD